ncbi:MAG: glycosyltransferase family 4 protein [bacterium]|nr:glycosyltransferase family 4 protein [bacterium]MCP5066671.1 glycosyltransferase family 4 protein [bacterium]
MRVALVHDWLTGLRGGERVLHEHARLFPEAEIFTLIHLPGSTTPEIEALPTTASPLSRWPGAARHYRKWLPLFPWAVGRLKIPAGTDLVLSSSHAVAKGIRPPPGAIHVCTCFTPMRYIWDQADAYLGTGWFRALASPLVAGLRRWDVRTSTPDRVHDFIAISETIRGRIRRHYGRDSQVIFPPVDVERFQPGAQPREDFFLMVGGFVPYKQESLAIDAFRELGLPLVVAGDGPSRRTLEASAPPNVRFLGRVSDPELMSLYQRCRALVYPQEEDFGIIPVEAQATGAPVIAFGAGGASETIIPLDDPRGREPTGLHFHPQTTAALAAAVRIFETRRDELDTKAIRAHAEGFSIPRYHREMRAAIEIAMG